MPEQNYDIAFAQDGARAEITDEEWKGGWIAIVGGVNGIPTAQQFNTFGHRIDKNSTDAKKFADEAKKMVVTIQGAAQDAAALAQSAIDGLATKAPIENPTFTGTVKGVCAEWTTIAPASSWSASVPYQLTIGGFTGFTSNMRSPIVFPNYKNTDSLATRIAQKEAWSCISDAYTGENSMTFICFEEKPTVNLPLRIKVVL